jgi:hypothetical protein
MIRKILDVHCSASAYCTHIINIMCQATMVHGVKSNVFVENNVFSSKTPNLPIGGGCPYT